jgi:hypothetical protein
MTNQTTSKKLNPESLVHPIFLPYFREYISLESEEERNHFWDTRTIDEDPETLTAAWLHGVTLIAERVKDLERRVNALVAEEH